MHPVIFDHVVDRLDKKLLVDAQPGLPVGDECDPVRHVPRQNLVHMGGVTVGGDPDFLDRYGVLGDR